MLVDYHAQASRTTQRRSIIDEQKDFMKSLTIYFCLPLLFIGTQGIAHASPIRAVIDAQNSQIVENIAPSKTPSLSVNQGSLLPLVANFSPVTQIHPANYHDWSSQVGYQVTVDSKQRDLSYSGELVNIEQPNGSFALKVNNTLITLPMNDFYLIPTKAHSLHKSDIAQYPSIVSYKSNDISWTPKRTLIFVNGLVSIINSAEIHNRSTHAITLNKSLLHYSPISMMRAKALQSTMRLNESDASPSYANSEVTYPLGTTHLKANSDTLVKLIRLESNIEKSQHSATIFTSLSDSGNMPLTFQNTLYFTLNSAALPGQYQTFWQRNGLLIPSNSTNINSARAKQEIRVVTNKSFDLTGNLSLISSTSQKLPTTQFWELTISNHANKPQSYFITQNTQGIISNVEGANINKKTASSLEMKGELQANKTQKIRYQIHLKE